MKIPAPDARDDSRRIGEESRVIDVDPQGIGVGSQGIGDESHLIGVQSQRTGESSRGIGDDSYGIPADPPGGFHRWRNERAGLCASSRLGTPRVVAMPIYMKGTAWPS